MVGLSSGKGVFGLQSVGQMVCIAELTEEFAISANATKTGAREVDAVIALNASNEARLTGLALDTPVGAS